ncbi:hypothetical protein BB561_001360 [Smittium simulii]|uniref:Uncharacterized protein n=1 Tax=Smittium simulii TaxID=133385 RepID=A0A2T9YV10_9FUNG|nr:hypothetical protein BB561_001360 [Smittium simulii]
MSLRLATRIIKYKQKLQQNAGLLMYKKFSTIKNDSTSVNFEDLELKEKAYGYQLEATELLNNGNFSEALELYTKANNIYSSGTILYNIGHCDIDGALEFWEKSIVFMPSEADVHLNLANAYFLNKKNSEKAIEHLKVASSLSPNDGEIAYNFGCILDASGKLDEAIQQYNIALKNGIEKASVNIRNASIKMASANKS